jgi:hypothetical protein
MDIGARDGIMGIVRAGNYGIREVVDFDTIYEAFLKFFFVFWHWAQVLWVAGCIYLFLSFHFAGVGNVFFF